MAKLFYEINSPFALCSAAGADKDAFDFVYDQRLLGMKTVKRGDDIVILGTDSNMQPDLANIKGAVVKGGSFWGIRVCALLKDTELDDEIPVAFPNSMNVDEEGVETTLKTWQEWIDGANIETSVSNVNGDVILKLVYSGNYLDSYELAEVLQTSTVISFEEYSTLKASADYQPIV